MFKSAATKIAHNSTLSGLGGNRDLRSLQELITSEKAVLQSLQKLSSDLTRSSENLRQWGSGEGEDLNDTLSASTTILSHLANALNQLASHEVSIRERMKAVRTQEESLDELRRRRKALNAKADAAEKKLSKMSPEHKSLSQQTQLLDSLREQIRSMDWEILSNEAKLGDFKRSETKNWMMLKFGGLLECAEKATIVGEMGKLIIEEIPLQVTAPGQTRAFYSGHERTEKLVEEAQRCIGEVVFDFQPVSLMSGPSMTSENRDSGAGNTDGLPRGSNVDSPSYHQNTMPNPAATLGLPQADEFGEMGYDDRQNFRGYDTMPALSGFTRNVNTSPYTGSNIENNPLNTNPVPPSSHFSQGSHGVGHLSTYPSQTSTYPPTSNFTTGSPPMVPQNAFFEPLRKESGDNSSFAAEVANALAYAENDIGNQDRPPLTPSKTGPSSDTAPNVPSYEQGPWSGSNPAGSLPKGAAAPLDRNPWDSVAVSQHTSTYQSDYNYPSDVPLSQSQMRSPEQQRNSIYPDDNDSETQLPYASPPPSSPPRLSANTGEQRDLDGRADVGIHHLNLDLAQVSDEQTIGPTVSRLSESHEKHDTAALNAAAAREVAREMDALVFSPPPGPPPSLPDYGLYDSKYNAQNRTPSPLLPPAPPFAQSPHLSISSSEANPLSGSESLSPKIGSGSTYDNTIPPSPSSSHRIRPSLSTATSPINTISTSALSGPSYGSELPVVQPLRSGSPTTFTPGARTISAAAFKRPAGRSPSGSIVGSPLPEVSPLSLRKKNGTGPGLPTSPYTAGQPPEERRSLDSNGAPVPEYTEFAPSYGDPGQLQSNPSSVSQAGYGRGKFATNLEEEGLR